eukprot:6372475-Pyramimonas_sp.AAC.1
MSEEAVRQAMNLRAGGGSAQDGDDGRAEDRPKDTWEEVGTPDRKVRGTGSAAPPGCEDWQDWGPSRDGSR